MEIPTQQMITPQLGSGERLLWSGRPQSGILIRSSDIFMIPFSLLWGGFAIFWEASVFKSGAPFFFLIFGSFFVVMGIYLMIGRFFIDAWQRGKTYYGLTNQRIIIISGLFNKTVKSLNLKTLTDVSLKETQTGKGTITFGAINPMFSWFGGGSWPGMSHNMPPNFEMIERAREVYEMIRHAQESK